jgi:hypothetical protein
VESVVDGSVLVGVVVSMVLVSIGVLAIGSGSGCCTFSVVFVSVAGVSVVCVES